MTVQLTISAPVVIRGRDPNSSASAMFFDLHSSFIICSLFFPKVTVITFCNNGKVWWKKIKNKNQWFWQTWLFGECRLKHWVNKTATAGAFSVRVYGLSHQPDSASCGPSCFVIPLRLVEFVNPKGSCFGVYFLISLSTACTHNHPVLKRRRQCNCTVSHGIKTIQELLSHNYIL